MTATLSVRFLMVSQGTRCFLGLLLWSLKKIPPWFFLWRIRAIKRCQTPILSVPLRSGMSGSFLLDSARLQMEMWV